MYDFNDSRMRWRFRPIFRTVSAMIPETVQGPHVRRLAVAEGPQQRSGRHHALQRSISARSRIHDYYCTWGTTAPLNGLNQGFWLNEMERALRNSGDRGPGRFLTSKA